MKKNVLVSVLLIVLLGVGLFSLTGCGSENSSSSVNGRETKTFYELKYVVPNGFTTESDFEENRDATKFYFYGEQYDGSINLTYKKGKDYSEVEDLYPSNSHTEEQINGITWRVMNDDQFVKSRFYYTVHNNDCYLIELNGVDKFQNDMEEFVKHLSFK